MDDGLRGYPEPARVARMGRAAELTRAVVGDLGGRVSHSPLGPEWSSDLDVYLPQAAFPHAQRAATQAGWIPLDAVLGHLGRPGSGQWAIVGDGEVLARADFQVGEPPELLDSILERIHRRGGVDLRAALELATVAADGQELGGIDDELLVQAAGLEAASGGTSLKHWLEIGSQSEQAARASSVPAALARLRPTVSIALTGVDGSGKSSLAAELASAFDRCGIPSTVVWTRPGMRLGWLGKMGDLVKRRTGGSGGLQQLSTGTDAGEISSRKGVPGWIWSMLITIAYLGDVWRLKSKAGGSVVIYDRHRLDAKVTLDVFYGRSLTRIQRWLVDRFTPEADLILFLDVPTEVAASRKPEDIVDEGLIARQLDSYRAHLGRPRNSTVRLSGTEVTSKCLEALRKLDAQLSGSKPNRWALWVGKRRRRS